MLVIINHAAATSTLWHSTRPAVTFLVSGHHRRLVSTKLYCMVTEVQVYKQLA